jgi:hypothetical protein
MTVANSETGPTDCFLCNPDSELVSWQERDFFVLAGLGPVVDGFCLMGTDVHVASMADVDRAGEAARDSTLTAIRAVLSARFGKCLVTEHGRVPVCRDDGNQHSAHCFHAHFLLFPGAADISLAAQSYYGERRAFGSTREALGYAGSAENYLYISPSDREHIVLTHPLNAPRQLARTLVALASGQGNLADWQMTPDRRRTVAIARELRELLGRSTFSPC